MRLPVALVLLAVLLPACAGGGSPTGAGTTARPVALGGASTAPRAGASAAAGSTAPGSTPAEPGAPVPTPTPTPTPPPDCQAIFARHAGSKAKWDQAAFKAYATSSEDPRDRCAQPDACGHAGDPGVIFALFDANEDGGLDADEVCDMRNPGPATPKPSATPTPDEPVIPGIVWGTPKGQP